MRSLRTAARRPKDDDQRILPLINVVFLLLIFFMIVGHLAAADPFHIEPPTSISETEPGGQDHIILVGADGRVAFDGAVMDDAALMAALTGTEAGEQGQFRLKADGGADAVRLVEIMEMMRGAGIEKVHLLTVPRDL